MLLQETKLLRHYENEWILDLRFRDYNLSGLERAVFLLVEAQGQGLASTLNTEEISKKAKATKELHYRNRVLKAPLFKVNGVAYLIMGFGSGHIGYFTDEFPDFPVQDPCPYDPQASYVDDVSSLYFAQALSSPAPKVVTYRQQDRVYHWKGVAYWTGNYDTDLGLHVFERRAKEPVPMKMVQPKLF